MTNSSEHAIQKDVPLAHFLHHAETTASAAPATANADANNLLLLPNKLIMHHPKAGINPLVDAAAYLFSMIGKLKLLKSYKPLNKLHQKLVQEINLFQETVKRRGYSSEFILVSRYA